MIAAFALVCAGLILTSGTNLARDKKEESKDTVLMGKITCNKCELKTTPKCETVLVTKGKDGKDVIYVFDKDSHGKYHDDICKTPKMGTVTGTVMEDGARKVIAVKKLEYNK